MSYNHRMVFRMQNLDLTTLELVPEDCRSCGWWQGYTRGWPGEEQESGWRRQAEDSFGGWGRIALADGEPLGLVQYGPSWLFPRSGELCPGQSAEDNILLACGMVTAPANEPIRKGLVLAALADLRGRGIGTVEAFCLRDGSRDNPGHLLDRELLRRCGFYPARSAGEIQLMRLELGGLKLAEPPRRLRRRGLLERIKRPAPAPAPVTLCHGRLKETEEAAGCLSG